MNVAYDSEKNAVYLETDGAEEIDPWTTIRLIADLAGIHVEIVGDPAEAIPE